MMHAIHMDTSVFNSENGLILALVDLLQHFIEKYWICMLNKFVNVFSWTFLNGANTVATIVLIVGDLSTSGYTCYDRDSNVCVHSALSHNER